MEDSQENHGGKSSYKSAEHINLRIPNIALGAEKCLRSLRRDESRNPLDEFVNRAHGHTKADHAERQPATPGDDVIPDKNLPAKNRGG